MTLAKIAKNARAGKEILGSEQKFFLALLTIFARESFFSPIRL
jgi:hypothetical protein